MKPISDAFVTLATTRQFQIVDLYQFTLATGQVFYFAGDGAETNIVYAGNTYFCGAIEQGPYFDRTDNKAKITSRLGSGNDQLVIDVIPGNYQLFGLGWLDAVRCGIFDAADFQLLRGYMATGSYGTIQDGCALLMFRGRVAEVDCDRSISTFTINDYRELLSQQLPKNLFGPGCVNSFGDTSCTVNLASFSENGTVQTGSTAAAINTTLTRASDYYDKGKITFTSGPLSGLSFGVSTWTQGSPGVIVPYAALPKAPQTGWTFTIAPGCDKTLGSAGCARYNNTANFRGFPFVPAPETAL